MIPSRRLEHIFSDGYVLKSFFEELLVLFRNPFIMEL